MDRNLIEQYAAGGGKLRAAAAGLTVEEMKAFPVAGTWSIQQVVIHLLDSDLIASDRMKRVAAEDRPTLIGFDETKFAEKLFYHEQAAGDAVTVFDLNRKIWAGVLRRLPDEAFARKGVHNERGEMSLEDLLRTYTNHLEHHLKFIYEKRKKLGKPLGT